jgi:hypothetical protein
LTFPFGREFLDVGGIELITEPYADDTLRDAFVWLLTIMRADLKFGIAK